MISYGGGAVAANQCEGDWNIDGIRIMKEMVHWNEEKRNPLNDIKK